MPVSGIRSLLIEEMIQTNAAPRILTVSPNAFLTAIAMTGLVFVPLLTAKGVLLFLVAGGLIIVRQPGLIVPEAVRYWWILAVPIFCLVTTVWSDHAGLTLRASLQLGVTFGIALAIANRVRSQDFYWAIWLPFGLAMLASILIGSVRSDGIWVGVFGSKNSFAASASTFTLMAVALILARDVRGPTRLFGFAAAVLGAFMLVKAQSAGTLALTVIACLTIPAFLMLRAMTPLARGALLLFGALILLLGTFMIFGFREELSAGILDATGKDTTLTGRTDLWQIALRLMGERPLGTGYAAFWVAGNSEAEMIWDMFLVKSRSGFNFHNTYLSNAVEIGVLGVALQVVVFGSALALSIRRAFVEASAAGIFAAIFMIELFLQSFIEVVMFSQFSTRSVIIIVLAAQGVTALTRQRQSAETVS